MKRSIVTRFKIASVLNNLLSEKEIEKVSVSQICRQCKLSRTTFYKYFQDIYDVHTWLWKYYLSDCMNSIYSGRDWHDGLLYFFKVMLKHKNLFINSEHGKTPFVEEGYKSVSQIMDKKFYQLGIYLTKPQKIIFHYCLYMHASAVSRWIKRGMKETPSLITAALVYALPDFIPKG